MFRQVQTQTQHVVKLSAKSSPHPNLKVQTRCPKSKLLLDGMYKVIWHTEIRSNQVHHPLRYTVQQLPRRYHRYHSNLNQCCGYVDCSRDGTPSQSSNVLHRCQPHFYRHSQLSSPVDSTV